MKTGLSAVVIRFGGLAVPSEEKKVIKINLFTKK